MLAQKLVLVAEHEPVTALGLSVAIERLDGVVAGPVPTVSEALTVLDAAQIAAAILEANLADRDVTPLALLLAKRRIPFVIHSAMMIPAELTVALLDVPHVPKPYEPELVVSRLVHEMLRGSDLQSLFPPGRHKRPRPWPS